MDSHPPAGERHVGKVSHRTERGLKPATTYWPTQNSIMFKAFSGNNTRRLPAPRTTAPANVLFHLPQKCAFPLLRSLARYVSQARIPRVRRRRKYRQSNNGSLRPQQRFGCAETSGSSRGGGPKDGNR